MKERARGDGWELRLGRWQDLIEGWKALEAVDVLVTDPPYTKRQIAGYRSGSAVRAAREAHPGAEERRFVIAYGALDEEEARMIAFFAQARVKHWAAVFSDHIGWGWIEKWLSMGGEWTTFAPVQWTKPNPPPRMAADGPCCAAEPILVGRPKAKLPKERRGHRPGVYHFQVEPAGGAARSRGHARLVGEKPLALMRAIVRDYTLPGDLVCDLYAGTGTTLLAALLEGRRAVGAEADPETYRQAVERLRAEEARFELARRQAEMFPTRERWKQRPLDLKEGEEDGERC